MLNIHCDRNSNKKVFIIVIPTEHRLTLISVNLNFLLEFGLRGVLLRKEKLFHQLTPDSSRLHLARALSQLYSSQPKVISRLRAPQKWDQAWAACESYRVARALTSFGSLPLLEMATGEGNQAQMKGPRREVSLRPSSPNFPAREFSLPASFPQQFPP